MDSAFEERKENDAVHRCQTQGPRATSGPPHRFMWPLAALKTQDHLFLKKLKTNILCFYFEGLGLNECML